MPLTDEQRAAYVDVLEFVSEEVIEEYEAHLVKQGLPIGVDTVHPRKPKKPSEFTDEPSSGEFILPLRTDKGIWEPEEHPRDERGRFDEGGEDLQTRRLTHFGRALNAKFNGIQDHPSGRQFALYTDNKTGSTVMVPLEGLKQEHVTAAMQRVRQRHGVKKAQPFPEAVREAYEKDKKNRLDGREYDDSDTSAEALAIGENDDHTIWRVKDGWGEFYFAAPKKSGDIAKYIASKMPDVMAYNSSEKYKQHFTKPKIKELGMGDTAWDKHVIAIMEAKGMGTYAEEAKKALEARTLAEVKAAAVVTVKDGEVEKYITHSGNKWHVHSEAGKVLGTHDSKADAIAQLGAIEANKKPKELEKVGWTDEAREAAAEARKPVHTGMHDKLTQAGYKFNGNDTAKNQSVYIHRNAGPGDRGMAVRVGPSGNWQAYSKHSSGFHPGGVRFEPHSKGGPDSMPPTSSEKPKEKSVEVFEAKEPGSEVATLIFDKEKYPKAEDAKAWANDHGFSSTKVDTSEGSFRIRQKDPGQYARMRTITLTQGVKAVIGVPKSTVKALGDAFKEFAKSVQLVIKGDVEMVGVEELKSGTIWKVSYGTGDIYFAEGAGVAVHVPFYKQLTRKGITWIAKAEKKEQRYTLGVVYPKGEVDFHGDTMTEEELEKAAWQFMSKDGVAGRVGLMHRPGTAGAGRVVESYIYRGPDWKMKSAANDKEEQTIKNGDWLMGVVWEENAWKAIQSGEISGYSLQGVARKDMF